MAGYFRTPEKTVEACRNLWFHTGDASRLDDAGRLHYVDRITPHRQATEDALREAGITAATWDRDAIGYVVRR
jgi:acyl-CoA synthetase (AMP-forming)/AMP-acid ligase II